MLLKTRISTVEVGGELWLLERCGRFTSSEIHKLMGDAKTFQNYVYKKVGEAIAGKPAADNVDTEATIAGRVMEPIALRKYVIDNGIPIFTEGRFIHGETDRFSSTPDGLIIDRESSDKLGYDVRPVQAKCPLTYEAFISLYLCETPFDILKLKKEYFWQVLDEIDNCGSLNGIFLVYHPDFSIGGKYKAINFRLMEPDPNAIDEKSKYPLKVCRDDLRAAKKRAEIMFNEVYQKMK